MQLYWSQFRALNCWQAHCKWTLTGRSAVEVNIQKMKDLLSSVHVVIKTLNLEISHYFGRLCQKIVRKCVPQVQHHYFSSLNKPDRCFPVLSLLLLLSLFKLPNMNKLKGDLVSSTVAYMYSSHTLSTLIKKKHFLFTWGWAWLHIGNIYSITQMKLIALLQGSHLSIWVSWLKREVQEMPCSFHYYHNEKHKKM